MPTEKDYYLLLGVTASATPAQIKEAYLARLRIIHPDRFDKESQPRDWKLANDMLAELNEAFSALKDSERRRAYDHRRASKEVPHPAPSPSRPSQPRAKEPVREERRPPEPRELNSCCGYFRFADLPSSIQARLVDRQRGKSGPHVRIALDSIAINIVVSLAIAAWFAYLFYSSIGLRWSMQGWIWYIVITGTVGAILGINVFGLVRFVRSSIRPAFYITPLYFIKTSYDLVAFWPLTALADLRITHQLKNGEYQSSRVNLKFRDGYEESLSFFSENEVASFSYKLREFGQRFVTALELNNSEYLASHDDFDGLPPTIARVAADYELTSKSDRWIVYAASVAASTALLLAAGIVNASVGESRWVSHSTAMPGNSLSSLSNRTSDGARSELPKRQPVPLGFFDDAIPRQLIPANGDLQRFTTAAPFAPFEIKAAAGSHYVVKLVDVSTNRPVMTVFVHGGTTVNVDVPLGNYEVRYASGTTWYGYQYLFGPPPHTAYSKADKHFHFRVVGNEVQGFTITLYKVIDGNLTTRQIDATEF